MKSDPLCLPVEGLLEGTGCHDVICSGRTPSTACSESSLSPRCNEGAAEAKLAGSVKLPLLVPRQVPQHETLLREFDAEEVERARTQKPLSKPERHRRKLLLRMRQSWFEEKAIEFRKQLLTKRNLRLRDLDQKQIRGLFRSLDRRHKFVISKPDFMEAVREDLMLPWDVVEGERFWRMLCNGPRLCFQEFTLIFLADEKKAKEAKRKAMAGLEDWMAEQEDASGLVGHGFMHAAGGRFHGRQPDNRDFAEQRQAWGRRGYSFARKGPGSHAEADSRDLSARPSDNSCRAYSFGHRATAEGQEDERDLLAQQNSNQGRAHRFGQGHVRRGAKAAGRKGRARTVDRSREVVRMQAAARGFLARRRLKQAELARKSAAAVVIQASYRRHWARELSRWLRVARSYERQCR